MKMNRLDKYNELRQSVLTELYFLYDFYTNRLELLNYTDGSFILKGDLDDENLYVLCKLLDTIKGRIS